MTTSPGSRSFTLITGRDALDILFINNNYDNGGTRVIGQPTFLSLGIYILLSVTDNCRILYLD